MYVNNYRQVIEEIVNVQATGHISQKSHKPLETEALYKGVSRM